MFPHFITLINILQTDDDCSPRHKHTKGDEYAITHVRRLMHLIEGSVECLIEYLVERLTEHLIECSVKCLIECLVERLLNV